MLNFTYYNPTRLIFAIDSPTKLTALLANYHKPLIILDSQVEQHHQLQARLGALLTQSLTFALVRHSNTQVEEIDLLTKLAQENQCDFILAIGGGSVIDAAKFVSCAINYPSADIWQILLADGYQKVVQPIPMGSVVTYPSAGSEMNPYFVASSKLKQRKIACYAPMIYPEFAILDPQLLTSLSIKQINHGIADIFCHIIEQYITCELNTPLQDLQAISLLRTLVDNANLATTQTSALENIMLSATFALNGLIECGAKSDWTIHWLSHELTALYNLTHPEAVLVLLPAVWQICQTEKQAKLLHYAQNLWQINPQLTYDKQIQQALQCTWRFLRSLNLKLSLAEYGIKNLDYTTILNNVFEFTNGKNLGENQSIDYNKAKQILELTLLPLESN